jgi:N-sulfoglucosamine sulfohydrolase
VIRKEVFHAEKGVSRAIRRRRSGVLVAIGISADQCATQADEPAICQPSREAMMTGQVPHHSGGLGFTPVHEGTPTLTTILQANGYFTAGIHKLEHMQPASCFPWHYRVGGKDRNPLDYEEVVKEAMAQARASKKPFFINCNINDPHRPFYGSQQAAEVDHNETGPYKIPRELHAEDIEVPDFLEDLPPIRKEYAQYCNSAQRLDISIGKVLSVLRMSPEADNTIIIFSADHGMPFPFAKATCYSNGSRTPTLVSWPGMGEPRVFENLTSNIDVLPTLLDILHISGPERIDGHSWVPIMQGHPKKDRDYVITHINTLNNGMAFPMRAIQNMRYSLFFSPWSDGKLEFKAESMHGLTYMAMSDAAKSDPLIAARVRQYIYGIPLAFYDLEKDPGERTNAIAFPEYKEQIADMKHLLLQYMTATNDPQLDNFKTILSGGTPVVVQPVNRIVEPD